MTAVFKKEFSTYFHTMIGYVLIAFLIIFTGIYFMVYNMYQGYPYFSYALSGIMTIMLVWIPVLTMRSFAEERKTGTDQLLLTSPVKVSSIVLGKFLSMAAVLAIPMIIFCLFPLFIKMSGTAYLAIDYTSILQFFLMGCVMIALGMFFSSLTQSAVISAVATFGAVLLLYLWDNLVEYLPDGSVSNFVVMMIICGALAAWIYVMTKNRFLTGLVAAVTWAANIVVMIIDSTKYENLLPDILAKFSILGAFEDAAYYSTFDVAGTVLELTVIAVFVFLTIQSIEKRRWS